MLSPLSRPEDLAIAADLEQDSLSPQTLLMDCASQLWLHMELAGSCCATKLSSSSPGALVPPEASIFLPKARFEIFLVIIYTRLLVITYIGLNGRLNCFGNFPRGRNRTDRPHTDS